MKKDYLVPGVLNVGFSTKEQLNKALFRVDPNWESGRIMDHNEAIDWLKDKYNCENPMELLDAKTGFPESLAYLQNFQNNLIYEEKELGKILKPEDFDYAIFNILGDKASLKHEFHHALYAGVPEYKSEIDFSLMINPLIRQGYSNVLKRLNYSSNKITDEAAARLIEGDFLLGGTESEKELSKDLKSKFDEFSRLVGGKTLLDKLY